MAEQTPSCLHYSLFGEPWWLDIVSGPEEWSEVRVEKGGELQARLPFTLHRKWGLTVLSMPPLTQSLGPWFSPTDATYANQLSRQKELTGKLIEKLPKHDVFSQNFHHSVANWLPWYWRGYGQTTRYTYILPRLQDSDVLWASLQPRVRTDIRKATERFGLSIVHDQGVDVLLEACKKSFQRQGLPGLPVDVVERICETCSRRECGRAFFAADGDGRIHAAAYVVWDERSAYYLLGGGDPELRKSGAQSLILWEAIKHVSQFTQSFDFEGSMLEPVERFFRGFGGQLTPYHQIARANTRILRTGLLMRDAMRACLGR